MNGEQTKIVDEVMWSAISPQAREDWIVHQAAQDPVVLASMKLIVERGFDKTTEELIKDHLETSLVIGYGLLPERSDEVFNLAEKAIWQEMEAALGENADG